MPPPAKSPWPSAARRSSQDSQPLRRWYGYDASSRDEGLSISVVHGELCRVADEWCCAFLIMGDKHTATNGGATGNAWYNEPVVSRRILHRSEVVRLTWGMHTRPGGGIGRRGGLKHLFPRGSTGSSPVLGTCKEVFGQAEFAVLTLGLYSIPHRRGGVQRTSSSQ
jgi:hypothetical protein